MKKQKDDSTSRYIKTLDYGDVVIRYDKSYVKDFVGLVELCDGLFYEIYTDLIGKLIAIKSEGED